MEKIRKKYSLEELKAYTLFELRILGRNIGVHNPTKPKKNVLIQRILEIQDDESKAVPISRLGRPVKRTALQSFLDIGDHDSLTYVEPDSPEPPISMLADPGLKHEFDGIAASGKREKLEFACETRANKLIGVFAPIEKGGSAVVIGPPRTGKTAILYGLAQAVREKSKDAKIIFLTIDETPENVLELEKIEGVEHIASDSKIGITAVIRAAEDALNSAKDKAVGSHVILFIDSLDRLAREYAGYMGRQNLAYWVRAVQNVKRYLISAKNTDAGSLTVIASLDTGAGAEADLLRTEAQRFAGAQVVLSEELAIKRIFPAISLREAGSRGDEKFLSPEAYEKNNAERRELLALGAEKAILQL